MYTYDFICTYKLLKDYEDNDIDKNSLHQTENGLSEEE